MKNINVMHPVHKGITERVGMLSVMKVRAIAKIKDNVMPTVIILFDFILSPYKRILLNPANMQKFHIVT